MKYLLLLISAFALAGCGSSPLSRYPSFPEEKARHATAMIISDALVLKEIMIDTAVVNLPENARNGMMCLNLLTGKLNEKGYNVDRALLSSIGLVMNAGGAFRVARTDGDANGNPEDLGIESPPFYVAPPFKDNPALRDSLKTLFVRLARTEKGKGDSAMSYPEAVAVGNRLGGGLMFVLLLGGYDVPAGRSVGKQPASGDYLLGFVPVHESTQVTLALFVLDAATGKVLWDDRKVRSGGVIHKEKLVEMLQDLVTPLP